MFIIPPVKKKKKIFAAEYKIEELWYYVEMCEEIGKSYLLGCVRIWLVGVEYVRVELTLLSSVELK